MQNTTPPIHGKPGLARLTTACRALVFLFAPVLVHAAGEQYLEAYNTVATLFNERGGAVDWAPVALKAPGESIAQSDLNTIRKKTVDIMRINYVVAPEFFDLGQKTHDRAFPSALAWDGGGNLIEPSVMTGIGQNGYFTKVPPECTTAGNGVYANNFTDVPLLWIHFQELRDALCRMRYTKESYYVWWLNNDEPDYWNGGCTAAPTWDEAKRLADTNFDGASPFRMESYPPHAFAIGKLTPALKYAALRQRSYAYGGVDRLSTSRPHKVSFYNHATIGHLLQGTYRIIEFDNAGTDGMVQFNRWTCWDVSEPTYDRMVVSRTMLGAGAHPAWGTYSVVTSRYHGPGWKLDTSAGRNGMCAVIEWLGFSTPALDNPLGDDPEDDGLAATGCEYTGNGRPPAAAAQWRNLKADPLVTFPLGISSGQTVGALRVKAYVSEYTLGSQAYQMFSLDTAVIGKNTGSGWGFVTVRRPSGVEVIFSLSGQRTGQPLYTDRRYRLASSGSGFEIRFAGEHNVVHAFGADGKLCQVRMRRKNHESRVAGTPDAWPGLTVLRAGGQIQQVSSPLWIALPAYNGALIENVKYQDQDGRDLGDLAAQSGSRLFIWKDAAGTPRSQTRVSVADGRTEITYGVFANGVLSIGDKTVRTEAYDEQTEEMTVTETRILYPDTPEAGSNLLVRTLARYPWGFETAVERLAVPGGSDQVTTYAYHTNALDTLNYGRLRLLVQPDGAWERYAYDAMGRRTEVVAPFANAAPDSEPELCRVTRYLYSGDPALTGLAFPADDVPAANDHRPRLVVETALGAEVSRTYHAWLRDRQVTRRCAVPGAAYDDSANLVSAVFAVTNGLYAGHTGLIEHPDGTRTVCTYDYDAAHGLLTTTRRSGSGTDQTVTHGTEQVTVVDAAGRTRSSLTRDIHSGLTLAGTVTTRDAFGRPLCVSNTVTGAFALNEYGAAGLERAVDEDGIATAYEYTPTRDKHMAASTRLGVTARQDYDVHGNVVATRRSAAGEPDARTSAQYDAAGRLLSATDEAGRVTTYNYATNAAGESVTTVTLPDGATQIETLYRDGRLRASAGTAAPPMYYDYGADAGGTYSTEYRGADATAPEWTRTYTDLLGRTGKIVHSDGYTVTHTYDTHGRQIAESDGFTTTLTEYDALSAPLRTAVDRNTNGVIDLEGPDRIVESASGYTLFRGTPVRETIARVYAAHGSAEPTEAGRALSALDGSAAWSIAYGRTNHTAVSRNRAAAARSETLTRPDGTQTVNLYTNGLLARTVARDADGAVIAARAFEYDAWNRLSEVGDTAANGEPRATRYHYNAAGQVVTVSVATASLTLTTAFEYDVMGRQIRTRLPDGGEVVSEYNLRGELIRRGGAGVYPVGYAYDARGRLTALATYREGANGAADTTVWQYEPVRGRLTAKLHADGSATRYEYQSNGLLRNRTWARGISTDYAYDADGVIRRVDYSDTTPGVAYERDRLGRVVRITDGIGAWTNAYHADGRLEAVGLPQLAGARAQYGYDAHGRLTNLALRVSGSTVYGAGYRFDGAGRIRAVSDGTHAAEYEYGPDGGTVTGMEVGGQLTVRRTFDGHNRLLAVSNLVASVPVSASAYAYDPAGRRTQQVMADGARWLYGYDELGQLTSAKKAFADGAPAGGAWFRYEFDTIGNRKSTERFRGVSTLKSVHTANSLNQYTQRTAPGEVWAAGTADEHATVSVQAEAGPARLAQRSGEYFWAALEVDNTAGVFATTNLQIRARITQVEGPRTNCLVRAETRSALVPRDPELFTYDADGNLLSDGLHAYTWDAENRLIAVETHPTLPAAQRVKVENQYDHAGRRAVKKTFSWDTDHWSPVTDHHFTYDGWNLIQERTHAHTPPSPPTLTLTNSYLWGLDISGSLQGAGGIGGLLTCHSPLATLFPCFDGNGNVVNLIDATTGATAAACEYGPFGELLKSEGQATPFGFSTKYHDQEIGLLYYGYRYYHPTTGRWLSPDPIGEEGGVNLYGFVGNHPVGRVDPIGLAVYVVSRELAIAGQREKFPDRSHVYLVFTPEDVDAGTWNSLVLRLGGQTAPTVRRANPQAETFSFHPRRVLEEQLAAERGYSLETGMVLGEFLNWVLAKSSFIGYNDRNDISAWQTSVAPGSQANRTASAFRYKIETTECEQYDLYERAIASRNAINRTGADPGIGDYAGLLNNCGSWAVKMLEHANLPVPQEVRDLNSGLGVGGSPLLTGLVAYPVTGIAAAHYYGQSAAGTSANIADTAWNGVSAVASTIAAHAEFETSIDREGHSYAGFAFRFGQ